MALTSRRVADCPNCSERLETIRKPEGTYYICRGCFGRAVTLPVMHRALGAQFMHGLWPRVMSSTTETPKACPFCRQWMRRVLSQKPVLELDACRHCMVFWFDEREFETVTPAPMEQRLRPLEEVKSDQRAREIIAGYKVGEMARPAVDDSPDAWWKAIPAVFGMPVEMEGSAFSRRPLVTWAIAATVVLISLWSFSSLRDIVAAYGLVPADPWRSGGVTWLTSFFLHGGWLHLIGNLYFLLVFGDNVEDDLGYLWYAMLLILATVVGDVTHVTLDRHSTLPSIGASGGISGVIAYYALKFPHARLGFLWRYYWNYQWFSLPAWGAFACWAALQGFGLVKQLSGFSNVSAAAHLGGAAVGLSFWLAARRGFDGRQFR